jgi:LCP family protein required for cell wall assembly
MTAAADNFSRETDIGAQVAHRSVCQDGPMPRNDPMHPHARRTVRKVIVTSQLCLALLTAIVVTIGYQQLDGNIGDGEDIAHVAAQGPEGPLNILVMGSDSREGAANDLAQEGGTGERSDTTILLHVSADRKDAYGVSLPRDAIVDRPDCEVSGETVPGERDAMFNSAFSVGGAQCTIQTVESLTGVYVDHFVTIDFEGFKEMVDAVDGVPMCIPEDVDDEQHHIHFDAGTQELEGQKALDYVRERYALSSTGDVGRMKRQQAFLASLVNKVMSAGTLSRPDKVYSFLGAVTDSIAVDEGLDSMGALAGLVAQLRHTGLSHIRFVTVPFEEYAPDPNRLVWAPEAEQLWEQIKADQPLGEELGADSLSADDPAGGSPREAADDEERRAAGLCA